MCVCDSCLFLAQSVGECSRERFNLSIISKSGRCQRRVAHAVCYKLRDRLSVGASLVCFEIVERMDAITTALQVGYILESAQIERADEEKKHTIS
jgi:hypothetical protein